MDHRALRARIVVIQKSAVDDLRRRSAMRREIMKASEAPKLSLNVKKLKTVIRTSVRGGTRAVNGGSEFGLTTRRPLGSY
jgi:hypothetical protein